MTASRLSLLTFTTAAVLLSACAQTSPANIPNQVLLWLVEPALPRPDVPTDSLIDCPARAESAVTDRLPWATPLGAAAQVKWPDGEFALPAAPGAVPDPAPVFDRCFALEVDGHVVVSGAILSRHSSRLLRFPVLTLMSDPGQPLAFQLTAQFPADLSAPAPATWNDDLGRLN